MRLAMNEEKEKAMELNKIHQNTDPKSGPLDGVQMRTDCVRTKFTRLVQKTRYPFKQAKSEANISASVETGTFSIRDMQTDVMLAVRLDDAMGICVAAVEAARRIEGCKTTESAGAVESGSCGSE